MSSQYNPQAQGYAAYAQGQAYPMSYAPQMLAAQQQQALPAGYAQAYPGAAMQGMSAAGMGQYALAAAPAAPAQPFLNFTSDRFIRGLLIGAAATYLLTNEDVQRTVIKGAVKAWSMVQGGIEEAKERFRDAEAELQAGAADPGT
jgi:hypothetical protein